MKGRMYEVPLSMALLGFGIGSMLANFHVGVKSRFQHAREECECKRLYVFQVPDVKFVRTLGVVIFTLF